MSSVAAMAFRDPTRNYQWRSNVSPNAFAPQGEAATFAGPHARMNAACFRSRRPRSILFLSRPPAPSSWEASPSAPVISTANVGDSGLGLPLSGRGKTGAPLLSVLLVLVLVRRPRSFSPTRTRTEKAPDRLALQLQQASLPRDEERDAPAFIGSHGVQRAARRNKGSLDPVLVRDGIPAAAQRFGRLLHLRSRTCSHPAQANRPGRFRQEQSPLGSIAKGLAPTRRKVTEIRRLARGKGLCGLDQKPILEDVERRLVRRLRLLFPPLPQLTQNRGSPAIHPARTGNPPRFILVANSLHGGLLESALT